MSRTKPVTHFKKLFRRAPLKVVIPAGLLVVAVVAVSVLFDKPTLYSYAGQTCVQQVTILPSVSRASGSSDFSAQTDQTIRIGTVDLVSFRTCFSPTKAPHAGVAKVSVAPHGGLIGKTTFLLDVPKPPVVNTSPLSDATPTTRPLVLKLSAPDSVFEYQLLSNGKTAKCPLKGVTITCDVASLGLLQGATYDTQLLRLFDDKKVGVVARAQMPTLTATAIVKSSVTDGQLVYEKPKSFTVEFDKDIIGASIVLRKVDGDTRTAVPSTAVYENKVVTLTIAEDLARESTYELAIDTVEASDGSTLVSPSKTSFKTSGGPKVTAVNVGKTGLALTQTVIITFDQPLSDTQDIAKFVSVKGVVGSVTKTDNQLFIRYANAAKCTDFSINVIAGLQSKFEVPQATPYSFSARTVCHTVMTIGYSAQGRPITAYVFGNGSQTILYTGAIHGNELSAKRLMLAWVDELELNAGTIPADKQIVVVPALNPDGVAAGTRNNTSNVDLNRNFDTFDWQQNITSPGNQPIENGGGTAPMSEPETRAIAAFTSQLRPRMTMSFHSIAGYVIANQGADSGVFADKYAQLTGYRNTTGSTSTSFDYAISGTYDDWIRDRLGLPSVLVELSSGTNSEFSRNKAALWMMVNA